MKSSLFKGALTLITVVITSGIFSIHAQNSSDAWKFYAQGKAARDSGNIENAISYFNQSLAICNERLKVNPKDQTEKLAENIQNSLPPLYLQLGDQKSKNQLLEEGIKNILVAKVLAEKIKDASTIRKADSLLPIIYYQLGVAYMNKSNFDAAIINLDKTIQLRPTFLDAYLIKAVIYTKKDDPALFIANCNKGIQEADLLNNIKIKERLNDIGFQYFQRKGLLSKNDQKYTEAADYFNTALSYKGNDATLLYMLATTYNSLTQYDNAIKTGELAIACETGDDEAKARIYLVIGEAYAKSGKTDQACSTFQKAAVGQYADYATFYMNNTLKCTH
jgi:tetratricopeptide (TPR) repeat protein